jgi:hypothetical protein
VVEVTAQLAAVIYSNTTFNPQGHTLPVQAGNGSLENNDFEIEQ